MIPRKKLIPLRGEFPRLMQKGRKIDSPSFGLITYPCQGEAKCAFVVSKKVDRRSVVRHEVKRKLALVAEKFLDRANGWELVFLAKQKAIDSPSWVLEKELEVALVSAGVFK